MTWSDAGALVVELALVLFVFRWCRRHRRTTPIERVTISVEEFHAAPDAAFDQALTKEVEVVLRSGARIYLCRKLPSLND